MTRPAAALDAQGEILNALSGAGRSHHHVLVDDGFLLELDDDARLRAALYRRGHALRAVPEALDDDLDLPGRGRQLDLACGIRLRGSCTRPDGRVLDWAGLADDTDDQRPG